MPRVTRKRAISAEPGEVWRLISDPYSLPRWWPRTLRAEGVEGDGAGLQWTSVLGTSEGRSVRADFRCSESVEGERYAWEQQLANTPFERHLRGYSVEVVLRAVDAETEVALTARQSLRGLSRLGSPMMRGAQRKVLDEALDGIERALT